MEIQIPHLSNSRRAREHYKSEALSFKRERERGERGERGHFCVNPAPPAGPVTLRRGNRVARRGPAGDGRRSARSVRKSLGVSDETLPDQTNSLPHLPIPTAPRSPQKSSEPCGECEPRKGPEKPRLGDNMEKGAARGQKRRENREAEKRGGGLECGKEGAGG